MYNLKGAGAPLSPSGNTSYRMEAHHYSGRVIYILFKPEPGVLEQFVPAPLTLPEEPFAFLKLYELKRRKEGEPYADPAFSHYNEAVVSTVASLNGEPGHYNLFMWVSKDWATWKAREVLGFPKKTADIELTKHFHEETLDPPVNRLDAVVSRYGNRIIEVSAELTRTADASELPRFRYFYGRRILPSPEPEGKVIDQIIKISVENGKTGNILGGTGTVRFRDCHDEQLEIFQPKEILGAYYMPIQWVLPAYPGKIVHEFN